MSYLGSWKIDDLLTFPAITTRVDTGAATDADSAPSYRVYEDETSTPILTGSMALLDSANTAGFYTEQITLSAANGFEKGKCYTIYIQATVNSVIGATIRTFQIEAEVDSNSVSNIGSGVITAAAIADNAIDAGAIADGAIDAATFAAGAITATVIATGAVDADALAADTVTEIWAGSTAPTAGAIADAVWDELKADHTTPDTFGDYLDDEITSRGTGTALTAADVRTAVGLSSANLDTQLTAIDDFLDTEIAAIKAKTDNLPASPAATGDIPSAASIADAVWEEMIADHSGTVGSTAEALDDAGSAGDPWNTAIPGSYGAGTAGKIVGDNLNATVSSRSSHSAADVWAVGTRTLTSFGTLIADIWANASRTLTAISDSAGVTTLLSRLTSTRALNLDNLDIEISQIPTASENAAEILSAAGSSPIASNIKEVNDTAITGTGTVGSDPWRKA